MANVDSEFEEIPYQLSSQRNKSNIQSGLKQNSKAVSKEVKKSKKDPYISRKTV